MFTSDALMPSRRDDANPGRVRELFEAVDRGQYRVDASAVAEALLTRLIERGEVPVQQTALRRCPPKAA